LNATAQSGDDTQNLDVEGGEKVGKTGEEQAGDTAPVKEDEDAKNLTLDEYRAQQQRSNKPSFNIRKPGEGDNEKAEWNKMKLKPLIRENIEGNKDTDEGYDEEDEDAALKKKQKEVPIQINFSTESSGFARTGRGARGGRGAGGRGFGERRGGGFDGERGGGRGGGYGEGGGGGGRGRGAAFKMDEESFPSLGAP